MPVKRTRKYRQSKLEEILGPTFKKQRLDYLELPFEAITLNYTKHPRRRRPVRNILEKQISQEKYFQTMKVLQIFNLEDLFEAMEE